MNLRRGTLIWLGLAIVAGAVAYGIAQQPAPEPTSDRPGTVPGEEKPLFQFQEGDVQAVSLTRSTPVTDRSPDPATPIPGSTPPASPASPENPTPGTSPAQPTTLIFSRTPGTPAPEKTRWQFVAATGDRPRPANDASVAFLLNWLTTGRSQRQLQVARQDLKNYGLQPPDVIVEVTLGNGQRHRLAIGKPGFNREFLYAQRDEQIPTGTTAGTPTTPTTIVLVPKDLAIAINRPLSEWEPQPLPKASDRAIEPSPSPDRSSPASPSVSPSTRPPTSPSANPSASPTP